jgi:hypothetical protein
MRWLYLLFLLTGVLMPAGGQSRGAEATPTSAGERMTAGDADEKARVVPDTSFLSLPRQMGARGMGDAATGDDCEKIDDAIVAAANGTVATQKIIHLAGGNWRCKDTHYLILLPRDMGDYLNTFSGKGAQFSLNLIQGSIRSCDISGGSGYNPNSYIIGQVIDYSHKGSGGAVYARADANGVPLPGSCVVEQAGMRYSSMRDVNVVSFAQGADGAAAIITLNAGRVIGAQMVANGSTMPNGNGYTSMPGTLFPAGFNCMNKPVIKLTLGKIGLSSTAIRAIASTTGSGCTYAGSDSGTVPVFIGGSDPARTRQAVNVAPEPANVLPCAIQLRSGITVDGDGALLEPDWVTGVYSLTASKVVFCDAYGDQVANAGLRNMTLSAIVGVWLSGSTQNLVIDNVSGIYSSSTGANTFAIRKGTGGGLLFYAAQTGPATYLRNINTESPGAIVIGGQWTSRAGTSGLGSMGGYDVARGTTARGGIYSSLVVDGIHQMPHVIAPNPPANSHSMQLDTFFEKYVWKSQNSPTANIDAPNGLGACLSTQPIAVRQVDTGGTGKPFYQCYRGVSDMLFVGIPRTFSISTAVHIRHLEQGEGYRPAVLAAVDQSRIEELSFVLGMPYVDPYVPAATAKSLGYVEVPDLSGGADIGPSVVLLNFSLPPSRTGFLGQYSITLGSASRTANACIWGISGVPNHC